jgi:hypothetical protein
MTLDDLMREFHAVEVHETFVDAPLERVYRTFRELDLEGSLLGWLFVAPQRLARFLGLRKRAPTPMDLAVFRKGGFFLLEDNGRDQVLIGMVDAMGNKGVDRPTFLSPEDFRAFAQPGFAKILWSVQVRDEEGRSRLSTETRVFCTDDRTRRFFAAYWTVVQHGSGLTRRDMLRGWRRRAEAGVERG